MAIVIIRQDGKSSQWKDALNKVAQDIDIYDFNENHPREEVIMAIVWKHPEGSLVEYPNLKCISSFGAGVDFIFEDSTVPKDIPITRVVDTVLAEDMSEFVIAQILTHLKRLNEYRIEQVRGEWKPMGYKRKSEISVGVMGVGELGSHLCSELVRYGFTVCGWANSPKSVDYVKVFTGDGQLSEFLNNSNILVCLLPLTKKTTGILDKALFSRLPSGSYLINVARGGHLVDADVLEFIDNDHLSGAALDVFHQEPLPLEHPFWNHPKIHMTPHIASVSDIHSVVPQLIENYRRLMAGKPLLNLVSIKKGY